MDQLTPKLAKRFKDEYYLEYVKAKTKANTLATAIELIDSSMYYG